MYSKFALGNTLAIKRNYSYIFREDTWAVFSSVNIYIRIPSHNAYSIVKIFKEKDKSPDIEQQPPFGDCK